MVTSRVRVRCLDNFSDAELEAKVARRRNGKIVNMREPVHVDPHGVVFAISKPMRVKDLERIDAALSSRLLAEMSPVRPTQH
jgi:hypothetical protein